MSKLDELHFQHRTSIEIIFISLDIGTFPTGDKDWYAVPSGQEASAKAKFFDHLADSSKTSSLIVLDGNARVISSDALQDIATSDDVEETMAIWSSLVDLEYYDKVDEEYAQEKNRHAERLKVRYKTICPQLPAFTDNTLFPHRPWPP